MFQFNQILLIVLVFNFSIFVKSTTPETNSDSENNLNNEIDIFWKEIPLNDVRMKQTNNMEKFLDKTTNLCENFFQYACGNWLDYDEFTHPDIYYDTTEQRYNKILSAMLNFVRTLDKQNPLSNSINLLSAEEKLRIYYSSCLNEDEKDVTDFNDFLNAIKPFGGISKLWNKNDWDLEKFDWIKLQGFALKIDVAIFFKIEFQKASNHNNNYIIRIGNIPSEYNTEDEWQKYKEFIVKILQFTGIQDDIEKYANDIIAFENDLFKLNLENINSSLSHDKKYELITINDLIKKYTKFNWKKFLIIIKEIDEKQLDLNEKLQIYNQNDFINKLIELLESKTSENLANFMLWRLLKGTIHLFDKRYINEYEKFKININRRHYDKHNKIGEFYYSRCFNDITSLLYPIVGSLYFHKYFDEKNIPKMYNMVNDIKENFQNTINNINWINETIKNDTNNYFNTIKFDIGRPQPSKIDDLNKMYDNLQLTTNKYIENWYNISYFEYKRRLEKGGTRFDKHDWRFLSSTIFDYNTNSNLLTIPIASLQSSNYHQSFLHAINFGGFGTFIASALIKGLSFLKNRNDLLKENLKDTKSCLQNQWNHNIFNPEAILLETVSVKQAFETYTKEMLKLDDEQLSGSNTTTAKQLFFLSYAQNRCAFEDAELANFRMMAALANLKEFSDAFSCPIGNQMNPEKKCKLLFELFNKEN